MKRTFSCTLTLALCLLFTRPLASEPNPFAVSTDLDKSIRAGLHALYSLDFEEAEKIFKTISDQGKEHPMAAFGEASVHWWRLSVYILEGDKDESAKFIEAVNRCIEYSKEKIKRGDDTGEGYMTLGGAYGLLGRWQAANQEYLSAYFTGKKAIKYLRKSLKVNPKMNDAYMGLGIFDYYVATLPAVVRVLAFLGGGDAKVGLEELETAANHGTYAQTPSKLFLTDLYSNQENKPEKAFELLASLKADFPASPFVHMLNIFTLYNHNRIEELHQDVLSYADRVEKGVYRKEFQSNAHFVFGLFHFKQKNWDEAIKEFELGIQTGNTKNPFFTWCHLYKGYSLDMRGRRNDAVAEYKDVLKQPRRWGSQAAAKRFIDDPFNEKEEALDKVKL